MIVRLFTDASVCQETAVSGWGCVAISDRGEAVTGGVFKSSVCDSSTAELYALATGLFIALSTGVACTGDRIEARVDNKYVVLVCRGHKRRINDQRAAALKMIDDLVSVYDVDLAVSHVRAHSSSRAGGHPLNHQADSIAKRHLRRAKKIA